MKTIILNKGVLLFCAILLSNTTLFAQPQNQAQNPSFEDRDCCPTQSTQNNDYPNMQCVQIWRLPQEHTIGNCIGECVGTSDYSNTCGFNDYPTGPRTGQGYIGFVHGTPNGLDFDYEYFCGNLHQTLIKDHRYYVEFYVGGGSSDRVGAFFSKDIPRQRRTNRIKEDPQVENPIGRILTNNLDWVKVSDYFVPDNNDLAWVTFGSFAKHDDTNGEPGGFFYIDDVKIIDLGPKCGCVDTRLIENTTYDFFEPIIEATTLIKAGFNTDLSSPYDGNVYLRAGANVTYKAGSVVAIPGEFFVDAGATFTAINSPCIAPVGGPIHVNLIPNVFTPNGNNINDLFCVNQTGATHYKITVFSGHFQNPIYNGSGDINSDPVCMWDGTCNVAISCLGPNSQVVDGTYEYIIDLSNCENTKESHGQVYVSHSQLRLGMIPPPPEETKTKAEFKIYPNPNIGTFTIQSDSKLPSDIYVYDILGNLIYKKLQSVESSLQIDLSTQPEGIYNARIINGEEVHRERIIIQK